MTAQEKAKELIDKFGKVNVYISIEPRDIECSAKDLDSNTSKQCALIAVDEIISFIIISTSQSGLIRDFQKDYWQQVKQEIEKL